MADLYGNGESEDISSVLQFLLHTSAATTRSPASAAAGGFYSGGGVARAVAESSSSFNFFDPTCLFVKESDDINLSSRVKNSEGYESAEIPVNPAPHRSSKRGRAAEVHNLSEKRRRTQINEKLRVLQNLIPNSIKTDKASMLDEVIEYLKQLQLHYQMLTMRNGLSSDRGYSLGLLQSMLMPPAELEPDEGNVFLNANRGTITSSRDQNVIMQIAPETTNHSSSAAMTSTNSGIQPSFVAPTRNHYGLFNHLAS